MFTGLLGRKFYTKCKSSIKLTKVRMEAIKKKRNAVQKYLRNDIADLLRTGHHNNAYGRAEGLLVELNMSSCYDLIEQFYSTISSKLSAMDKQKECPEECREAVASLMYAAARFADLPELRDLRNMFTQRYGNSMEAFVNKEFVYKLRSKPPTKDMKLQLLLDIAHDSSIEWNSKALEQNLFTPPPPERDYPEKGSFKNTYDDGYSAHKSKDDGVLKRSDQDVDDKVSNAREYDASNLDEEDLPSHGRKEVANDGYKFRRSRVKEDIQFHEEADSRKPVYSRFMPPPYVRPKATPPADSEGNEMGDRMLTGVSIGGGNLHRDDSVGEADKPKPRSVRRRNLKPPPGRHNAGSDAIAAAAKMNSIGTRQRDARSHEKDEEERLMDGLLLHYSKKPSPYETDKIKANLKLHSPSEQTGGNHGTAKPLPTELTMETKARKGGPPRASSFEPDMMNLTGHVHPNLPDYDDLATRIAALSGR